MSSWQKECEWSFIELNDTGNCKLYIINSQRWGELSEEEGIRCMFIKIWTKIGLRKKKKKFERGEQEGDVVVKKKNKLQRKNKVLF